METKKFKILAEKGKTGINHLYIFDDREIKSGDWCIMLDSFGNLFSMPQQYFPDKGHVLNSGHRKIVASTNKLIAPKSWVDEDIRKIFEANNDMTGVTLEMFRPNMAYQVSEHWTIKTNEDDSVILSLGGLNFKNMKNRKILIIGRGLPTSIVNNLAGNMNAEIEIVKEDDSKTLSEIIEKDGYLTITRTPDFPSASVLKKSEHPFKKFMGGSNNKKKRK